MRVQEAMRSGLPFKRPKWNNLYIYDGIEIYKLGTLQRAYMTAKDLVAEDYILDYVAQVQELELEKEQ